MKFSESWLREWVSPALDTQALSEQLSMAGLEVDSIEKVAGDFNGVVVGEVVATPRGTNGFGYDPIFVAKGHTETFGELDPAVKHAMSHRADAFAKFVAAVLS